MYCSKIKPDLGGLFSALGITERDAHTGFCMNSRSLSFSSPRRTLFWGVLPGKSRRVMESLGLSGSHTSRAQMDTRLARGSQSSLPSTLIPDLKVPRVCA